MKLPVWTRLEPELVARDVEAGLAAPVADPAWLLGRQWQVGELTAEDAATPVAVEIDWAVYPLDTLVIGGQPRPLAPELPLEAALEPEPAVAPSWRTRLTSGAALVDELRRRGLTATISASLAPRDVVEPALRALVRALGARAIDAEAVLTMASGGVDAVLAALAIAPTPTARAAVTAWVEWYRARTGRAGPSAWVPERSAYQAQLQVTTDRGRWALTIDDYRGGRFDWAELRAQPIAPTAAPTPTPRRDREVLLPTAINFRGGPSRRFFEFEDGAVNFGGLGEHADDLATRLLVEITMIYGGDWFVVPLELPIGGLAQLGRVAVRSTFDDVTVLAAPQASDPWRAFTLTALPDHLPLLPTVSRSLDGPVLEAVALARDEGANLAWLIERVTADALDRGATVAAAPTTTPPPPPIDRYRPMAPPPPGWRPWVARGDHLVPATMPDGVPPPRGRIAAELTRIAAAALGPTGLAIERRWQVATGRDGRAFAWLNRQQRPGAGDLPSAIAFDELEPRDRT